MLAIKTQNGIKEAMARKLLLDQWAEDIHCREVALVLLPLHPWRRSPGISRIALHVVVELSDFDKSLN